MSKRALGVLLAIVAFVSLRVPALAAEGRVLAEEPAGAAERPAEDSLAAPVVKIAAASGGGIDVTWDAVPGSPLYMVYYRENDENWQVIGVTEKTDYTHGASELKSGVTYQFTVRCCDADMATLLSGYAASNSLKYCDMPVVKAALDASEGIVVSWDAVKDSPLYMVYCKGDDGSWNQIGTTADTSYVYPLSELKGGAAYQFAVRCCDADKTTPLSGYAASSSLTYCAVPVVKIAAASGGGIDVTWDAVPGSPLYMVYYRENDENWQVIGVTEKTDYTHGASELKSGVTYQFTVRCCDADMATLLSGYAASNSLKYCAAPSVKIAAENGGIRATWDAVPGSPLYMVYSKENDGPWQDLGVMDETSYTIDASALKAGVTYQFAVRCCDSDKTTLLSGYAVSNSLRYCDKPDVTISIGSNDGIDVTWNKVSGSPLYMVYYKENGGSWQKIGVTEKTSYTHDASKLESGMTYWFTARCCDADGKTLLSGYAASNPLKYYAAPSVEIAPDAKGGIAVSWTAVKDSPQYMVYYQENGGMWHQIGATASTAYTCAAARLKSGVTYQFTVRCCAEDEETPLSGAAASNSLKYYAVPSVKIATAPGGGIAVSWSAEGDPPLYMVYCREDRGSWEKIGTTPDTSFTYGASAVKRGVEYQFTVRCCDADGKTLLSDYTASNSLKYE